MNTVIETARMLAESKLATQLPRRWTHVQAVGRKAEEVSPLVLDTESADLVSAAAWVHDIGYAPDLALTGFHPLDGARWLRSEGVDERVVGLVAHHSCAILEAQERGMDQELDTEFHNEASMLTDVLLYVDMTTGPDGQTFDVVDRLAEIESRYGPGDLITRFIQRARPRIIGTVRRIETGLAAH